MATRLGGRDAGILFGDIIVVVLVVVIVAQLARFDDDNDMLLKGFCLTPLG